MGPIRFWVIEIHTCLKNDFFLFFMGFSRILGIFDYEKYSITTNSIMLNSINSQNTNIKKKKINI